VDNITFSPDAKFLGISTEGKEIALYDNSVNSILSKGTWPSLLKSIAFTPDNQRFLASDGTGTVQAWDVPAMQAIEAAGKSYPQASSVSSSSAFLALGTQDEINILDTSGNMLPVGAPGENTLLALSDDGTWLAAADSSGNIQLWKHQGGEFTSMSSLLREQAESLALNADGSLLAVGTAQNVFLIDAATASEIARIPYRDVVTGVDFSPDGKYLTTVSSNVLQRWELAKIEQIKSPELLQTACSRLVEKFSEAQLKALFDDPIQLCSNSGLSQ
jgi:WD40 repeat protein